MAEQKPADQTDEPAGGGHDNRADTLLPAGDDSSDGRFEVAEEVSLDQQSDAARRIGQAPEPSNGIADAIPESLKTPVPSQAVPDKP